MALRGHPFLTALSSGCASHLGTPRCHRALWQGWQTVLGAAKGTAFTGRCAAAQPHQDTQLIPRFGNLGLCSCLWFVTSFPCRCYKY